MISERDHRFMARALHLARKGLYTTDPNPRVGCVLTNGDQVVAEGYHQRAGEPHAERIALNLAGEAARGSTAYVTLEPCSHHGRTPPCANALIAAGVSRVVAAMQDPNPLVGGQGLARLQQAGIQVETGLMENEARALNPGFIKRMEQGLPFVRCKMAMSLDGRTAMANGESQWITGADARMDVQYGRARSSAILTGIGTVVADDPSMNVRLTTQELHIPADSAVRQPLRVVLDPELTMPLHSSLLQLPGETLIFYREGGPQKAAQLEQRGARLEVVSGDQGTLDLKMVLKRLAALSINEVWIECGATLAGAFVAQGLVDELIFYIAPHLMGDQARGLFHLPGLEQMADRIQLSYTDIRQVGADLRITATPNH